MPRVMNPNNNSIARPDAIKPGLLAGGIVAFYQFWHGRCHLPGAGFILRKSSQFLSGLQRYPLGVKGVGTVPVDFRDHAGFLWLQHLLGDKLAAFDIEEGLFRALTRLLKPQDVFWDIGANMGTVSAYVATSFPQVRIFAFEPNPGIFKSVHALFADHARVKVYPFALSNADAEVAMTIPKGKSVGGSIEGLDYVLTTSNLTQQDVEQVRVRAFRGDTLIEQESALSAPNVIKIDVEGHEVSVIEGFTKTIAKCQPAIIFEHLYLSDADVSRLIPSGYSIRSVNNESGELTAVFDRSVGHNSVLLPAILR